MSDKKFRVSSKKRISATWALLGGFIFMLLIENAFMDIESNVQIALIVAGAVSLVLTVSCAIFVKEYYMQIREDGFELIKGNRITRYSFQDFAGSNVTRHYANGIYYGTTREIRVRKQNGDILKLNANNLSKSMFAELVSYLEKTGYIESHDINAIADYFRERHDFRISAAKIIKANWNKAMLYGAAILTLIVVFLVMFGYYIVTHIDSAIFMTIMIFAGLGALIFGILEFVPVLCLYLKVMNLPDTIFMDQNTLGLGNTTINADGVQNILMVPASYDILARDMTIILKNDTKYKYCFGKKDLKNKLTYADYEKLYADIELWCILNNVNFTNILG